MFFLYGAQGLIAFLDGPSSVEVQGVDAFKKIKDKGVKSINPTRLQRGLTEERKGAK
jgi:hypothetical protein